MGAGLRETNPFLENVMTKRYSNVSWRGALYNALRATGDGVAGFSAWAGEFRDRQLSAKTLYKKLDGSDARERVAIEDAELITEYVLRSVAARDQAFNWLRALGSRYDLAVIEIDAPPPGGWPNEVAAIQDKAMQLTEYVGGLMGELRTVLSDSNVTPAEADNVSEKIAAAVHILLRIDRNVRRAARCDE